MPLHFHHRIPKPLRPIFHIVFIMALSTAILEPFLSSFVKSLVGSESIVGLVFSVSYLFSLLVNLSADNIVARLGKSRTLVLFLVLLSVGYTLLFYTEHESLFMLFYGTIIGSLLLINFSIDLYIKHWGDRKNLALLEGQHYTLINLGWLIGPFIGGYIISIFDIRTSFLLASILSLVSLVYFLHSNPSTRRTSYRASKDLMKGIRLFFSRPALRSIYILYFGLLSFYGLNGIYLPLLLFEHGATVNMVGLIFSFSIIPFITFEYFFAYLAARFQLERVFFGLGFLIIALSQFMIFQQTSILGIGIFAFLGMVGASMIEPLSDTYFLSYVPERDTEPLSIYRTAWGMARLLSPLFGSLIVFISGVSGVFMVSFFVLLFFTFFSFFLPPLHHAHSSNS